MAKVIMDKKEEIATFGSIVVGAIFIWSDQAYLKIECMDDEACGKLNVIMLSTGDIGHFYDSEPVRVPKSAEIKISI